MPNNALPTTSTTATIHSNTIAETVKLAMDWINCNDDVLTVEHAQQAHTVLVECSNLHSQQYATLDEITQDSQLLLDSCDLYRAIIVAASLVLNLSAHNLCSASACTLRESIESSLRLLQRLTLSPNETTLPSLVPRSKYALLNALLDDDGLISLLGPEVRHDEWTAAVEDNDSDDDDDDMLMIPNQRDLEREEAQLVAMTQRPIPKDG